MGPYCSEYTPASEKVVAGLWLRRDGVAGARLVPCPAHVAATMRKPLRRGAVPPMSQLFMQPDRIHPNDEAQPLIAAEIFDALRDEWELPGGREPEMESAEDPERRGAWCQCVVA